MGRLAFVRSTFASAVLLHGIWLQQMCFAAEADSGNEHRPIKIRSVSNTPKVNLPDRLEIYEAISLVRDNTFVSGLARKCGLSGELQAMPIDMSEAPGVWSFDQGGYAGRRRSVYASYKLDEIGFVTGDDGHRWDPSAKELRVSAVPETKRAVALAESAVRGHFGVEVAKDENGDTIFHESTLATTYLPRGATDRVTKVKRREIKVYQVLPNGMRMVTGETLGWFQVGFVSEERMADIVGRPIKVKSIGRVRGMSLDEIITALKQGKAWSWRAPRDEGQIDVKQIVVEYRTGNHERKASRLTPVYRIKYQPTSGAGLSRV